MKNKILTTIILLLVISSESLAIQPPKEIKLTSDNMERLRFRIKIDGDFDEGYLVVELYGPPMIDDNFMAIGSKIILNETNKLPIITHNLFGGVAAKEVSVSVAYVHYTHDAAIGIRYTCKCKGKACFSEGGFERFYTLQSVSEYLIKMQATGQ